MVPTHAERRVQSTIRKTGELLERMGAGTKLEVPAKYLGRAFNKNAHIDPTSIVKATTFHLLLGVFNPAQLLVQGMGMAVAASVHPRLWAKTSGKTMKMLTALPLSDDIILAKFGQELLDDVKEFRASGIPDSIKINGDYRTMASGMPFDTGVINRALDKGLMFYRAGEMFNKVTSWNIAKAGILDGTIPVPKDRSHLQAVFDETTKLSLNLSKANAAEWQKGWRGIPTQFWQVFGKFSEQVFGSHLTPRQKLSLVVGQVALFGIAGHTFENMAGQGYAAMTGRDVKDLSETEIATIRRGLLGLIAPGADLSGRGQLLPDIEAMYTAIMYDDNKPWAELMLGATANVFHRADAFGDALMATVKTPDIKEEHLELVVKRLLALPSLGNQIQKAMLMHNAQLIVTRRGSVAASGGFTTTEKLWQSIGFQPARAGSELYDALTNDKHRQMYESAIVQEMLSSYYTLLSTAKTDEEKSRAKDEISQLVYLSSANPAQTKRIMEKFLKKCKEGGKTIEEKAVASAYKTFLEDKETDIYGATLMNTMESLDGEE